jgi:glycosyltransferase involved in cell wall biosynthesis
MKDITKPKENPLISVIIPAFNAEKYIIETIHSVLNQTYPFFELIIINDGSVDNTEKKIKELKDHRIRYFYQSNKGVASARNNGLKQVKGDYIAFLDADDLWHSTYLEKKINFLLLNTEYKAVYSEMQQINEKSEKNKVFYNTDNYYGWILNEFLLWKIQISPSNLFTHKDVYKEIGVWNEQLSTAADQELLFRIASKFQIGKINDVLVYYRIHSSNMHSDISRAEREHKLVYKTAKDNKLFYSKIFYFRCLSNLYSILAGSWWVNGNNKIKAIKYILLSIIYNPLKIFYFTKKLFQKIGFL